MAVSKRFRTLTILLVIFSTGCVGRHSNITPGAASAVGESYTHLDSVNGGDPQGTVLRRLKLLTAKGDCQDYRGCDLSDPSTPYVNSDGTVQITGTAWGYPVWSSWGSFLRADNYNWTSLHLYETVNGINYELQPQEEVWDITIEPWATGPVLYAGSMTPTNDETNADYSRDNFTRRVYPFFPSGNGWVRAGTDIFGDSWVPGQVGSIVSLQSFNFPTNYVRHQNGEAKITPINSALDEADATFKIVRGLGSDNSDAVSFESVEFPGNYLRHQNGILYLQPFTGNDLQYDQDATFRLHPGNNGDPGYNSIESYFIPNAYLRHQNGVVVLNDYSPDSLFAADSSFKFVSSLEPSQWYGHSYGHQFLTDDSGTTYMFYEKVTTASAPGRTEIFARRLLSPGVVDKDSNEIPIITLGANPYPATYRSVIGGNLVEGPRPVKMVVNGRTFYVLGFSSGDFTTNTYGINIAVAQNITGPYHVYLNPDGSDYLDLAAQLRETYGFSEGPGRPNFFQDPAGQWWILFHAATPDSGGVRSVYLAPLDVAVDGAGNLSITLSDNNPGGAAPVSTSDVMSP